MQSGTQLGKWVGLAFASMLCFCYQQGSIVGTHAVHMARGATSEAVVFRVTAKAAQVSVVVWPSIGSCELISPRGASPPVSHQSHVLVPSALQG